MVAAWFPKCSRVPKALEFWVRTSWPFVVRPAELATCFPQSLLPLRGVVNVVVVDLLLDGLLKSHRICALVLET